MCNFPGGITGRVKFSVLDIIFCLCNKQMISYDPQVFYLHVYLKTEDHLCLNAYQFPFGRQISFC